jgi:hypothetical protein
MYARTADDYRDIPRFSRTQIACGKVENNGLSEIGSREIFAAMKPQGMTDRAAPRLSAEGIAALRYAGQRQLTRWGARRLSPRDEQRRDELTAALRALTEVTHCGCDCELRRVSPGR